MGCVATDFDRQLSLAQLAGDRWRKPGPEATGVYRDMYGLRRVPAWRLGPEDLRLLVTHHIALEFTVPLALEMVEQEPQLLAYLFHGDLLTSLLRVDHSFWEDHVCLRDRVSTVLDGLRNRPYVDQNLVEAAELFPG